MAQQALRHTTGREVHIGTNSQKLASVVHLLYKSRLDP
jgi:hypothetical protein